MQQNELNNFISHCLVIMPTAKTKKKDLFQAYVDYCAKNHLYPVTKTQLCQRLTQTGCLDILIGPNNHKGFLGVGLKIKPFSARERNNLVECPNCNSINVIESNPKEFFCRECQKNIMAKIKTRRTKTTGLRFKFGPFSR